MITAVAMSGGVDSSAAAWLLLNDPGLAEAYPDNRIIGVTHWWDELRASSPGLQERAAAVCRKLGIDYRVTDLGDVFRRCVMDDFSAAYLDGRTPNPCVRCNERVRFSAFYGKCLEIVTGEGLCGDPADFRFCTGHYVRTAVRDGRVFLRKAADPSKDQSYMLYRIPSDVLSRCIFPLGEYTKARIKEIADSQGFFGKAIKESQDICFVSGTYTDFLRERLEGVQLQKLDRPGIIKDGAGHVLGTSRGYLHYTIGQRKGLGLGDGPWYVTGINAADNVVYVGRRDELGKPSFRVGELNWFADPPAAGSRLKVQVRYNSTEYGCRLFPDENGCLVELDEPAAATPGQSAVFYDGDLVAGGGIIRGEL